VYRLKKKINVVISNLNKILYFISYNTHVLIHEKYATFGRLYNIIKTI